MDVKELSIDDIGLSVRSANALHRGGIFMLGELLALTEEELRAIRNLGNKSVDEIMEKRQYYSAHPEEASGFQADGEEGAWDQEQQAPDVESIDPIENYEEWLQDDGNRQLIVGYFQREGHTIDVLDTLSAKAYNLLIFAGYSALSQVAFMEDEELHGIFRMDNITAAEIRKSVSYYLRKNKNAIVNAVRAQKAARVGEKSGKKLTDYDMSGMSVYREKILEYVKLNDFSISQMGLSVRAVHCLSSAGYFSLSDIVFLTSEDLMKLKNMGVTTANEIRAKVKAYFAHNEEKILLFISGDTSIVLDEGTLVERILKIYQSMGFKGLHFAEIVEKIELPEGFDTNRVKTAVGKLIAERKLEYVDFLVYKVYPTFMEYLNKCGTKDERSIQCIQLKMQGETLETIAKEFNVTREAVRQIIRRTVVKMHNQYVAESGTDLFDEDYYRHLYTNYAVDKSICTEWLALPVETYYYLDMFNSKGKKDLAEALDDPDLDVGLKLKIRNYLNRNKIFIDGVWIEKRRTSLEEYILMKYCTDEMTFDEFVVIYNDFLKSQEIPYSDDLYYSDDIKGSRRNRLTESRVVLWKQSQRLRYYDIDSRDYTELLEGLSLETYENIELSTLKFVEDFPELMVRYDIRDQYELHNLLKKIVPEGSFHDFHCGRMPIISFGEFNRDEAVLEVLINNAPISQAELVDRIHDEYGYEKETILWNMLQGVKEFYHMGMYTIDSKVMEPAHKEALQAALTDDFYYVEEVKRVYKKLFPDADPEAVNPYNLKTMGFAVLSKYVLKNWPSLEAYFRHLLLESEIVDLAPLRKRFGYIQMWYQTLTTLKRDYDILEFEPNRTINFSKMEKAGITKEMFKEFCDAVNDVVEDGMYFSAKSLRVSGFNSELYDLGFSDWFYSNILCCDPRFSFCSMLGTNILYKGTAAISVKSFITDQIKRVGVIDIVDLMNDLNEDFGCNVSVKSDITQKIQGTEIFYDPILERLYANAELYYRELDETEGM